eukprot:TRINITY_DN3842_c0_g1_i1.p1 TRINITY_DN3842_c0_g1~~TRINITY_DN3842_c0_g1_i1.p1  ORF type:complete len:405 (+),score=95.39 TRINITY_DN3842_c0_g1_i1:39-1253(+)
MSTYTSYQQNPIVSDDDEIEEFGELESQDLNNSKEESSNQYQSFLGKNKSESKKPILSDYTNPIDPDTTGVDHYRKVRLLLLYSFMAINILSGISSIGVIVYYSFNYNHWIIFVVSSINVIFAPLFPFVLYFFTEYSQKINNLNFQGVVKITMYVWTGFTCLYYGSFFYYNIYLIDVLYAVMINWFFCSLSFAILIAYFRRYELLFGDCWKPLYNKVLKDNGPSEWNLRYAGHDIAELPLVNENIVDTFSARTTCLGCIEDGVSEVTITDHRFIAMSTRSCFPNLGLGGYNYTNHYINDETAFNIQIGCGLLENVLILILKLFVTFVLMCPWVWLLPLLGVFAHKNAGIGIGSAAASYSYFCASCASHSIYRDDMPRFRKAYTQTKWNRKFKKNIQNNMNILDV